MSYGKLKMIKWPKRYAAQLPDPGVNHPLYAAMNPQKEDPNPFLGHPTALKDPFPIGNKQYFKLKDLQFNYPRQEASPFDFMYALAPIFSDVNADLSLGSLYKGAEKLHGKWLRDKPGLFALALGVHAGALAGGGTGLGMPLANANRKVNGRGPNPLDFIGDLLPKDLSIPLTQHNPLSGQVFDRPITQGHSISPMLPGGSLSGLGMGYNFSTSQHGRLDHSRAEMGRFGFKENELWYIKALNQVVDTWSLRKLYKDKVLTDDMTVVRMSQYLHTSDENKSEEELTAGNMPFVKNGFYGPALNEVTLSPYAQLANHRPSGQLSVKGGANVGLKSMDRWGNHLGVKGGVGLSSNALEGGAGQAQNLQEENQYLNQLVLHGMVGLNTKIKIGEEHTLTGNVDAHFRRTLSGPTQHEMSELSAGLKWESKMRNGSKMVFEGKFQFDPWKSPQAFKMPITASIHTARVILEVEVDPLNPQGATLHLKHPLTDPARQKKPPRPQSYFDFK